ncbi:hypothetical protein OV079_27015 [Nannocystis pusilla]|uniref:Uncharacterized protein n=1 Tax=Nannocystis pusilla TaxID=889268 RepID=A0A9X3ETT6_9BACT|nr:hypothetical protein [Nannocystis pusilla]MCY1009150.1 hypothetical protein [Nannocystis pusilla]
MQSAWQPSSSAVLPSSHCSPGSIWPLPHGGEGVTVQSSSQPSSGVRLPSSHASPGSSWPSPHSGALEVPPEVVSCGASLSVAGVEPVG